MLRTLFEYNNLVNKNISILCFNIIKRILTSSMSMLSSKLLFPFEGNKSASGDTVKKCLNTK